ncbi:MAG TPA: cytochrome c biogenesis protein CcdA, partial [Chitinophagaceae bacterium]|nr:cytochrome c biogenesis protein CcdA [Chitinophagaceae bacterium]
MKQFILSLGLCLLVAVVAAQNTTGDKKTVEWSFSAAKSSDKTYLLSFKATIEKGWKLFSTTMKDDEPNTRIKPDSSSLRFIAVINNKETGDLRSVKEPLLGDLPIRYFENNAGIELTVQVKDVNKDIKGVISYMAIRGDSVAGPEEVPFRFSFDASGNLVAKQGGLTASATGAQALKRNAIDVSNPVNKCGGTGGEDSGKKSLLGIFILGFLGGLVGLIMPCTFPMIPLTVSFFTKKSGNRQQGIKNAFLYGFFIFLIYVLLSVPFYFLDAGSSGILNNISTNAWLNIGFAVVFIAFALSFFGYYEIGLPGNLSNTVDSKSSIGSISGIFFMALTLAIVSFSCTGPILGTLLVGALTDGAFPLTVAMAGFGLALGLPFALFALFPHWLSSLPKSGGWMNTVKIVFGFIELALALKYLSNADLVMHWGLLKRETFFALWIIIGFALSLYLFGLLKFAYDPPPKKLSGGRIATGLIFLLFTIYLLPGLTNTKYANIALVSGFPPPLTYSLYKGDEGKGLQVVVVNDYEKALQLSKEQHKPILIDFTGWACVNCRKMEENVWPDEIVKGLIDNNFIRVSLYVDDRKILPDEQQFLFTNKDGSKKSIKTVG